MARVSPVRVNSWPFCTVVTTWWLRPAPVRTFNGAVEKTVSCSDCLVSCADCWEAFCVWEAGAATSAGAWAIAGPDSEMADRVAAAPTAPMRMKLLADMNPPVIQRGVRNEADSRQRITKR